jgi:hypothetical protein
MGSLLGAGYAFYVNGATPTNKAALVAVENRLPGRPTASLYPTSLVEAIGRWDYQTRAQTISHTWKQRKPELKIEALAPGLGLPAHWQVLRGCLGAGLFCQIIPDVEWQLLALFAGQEQLVMLLSLFLELDQECLFHKGAQGLGGFRL